MSSSIPLRSCFFHSQRSYELILDSTLKPIDLISERSHPDCFKYTQLEPDEKSILILKPFISLTSFTIYLSYIDVPPEQDFSVNFGALWGIPGRKFTPSEFFKTEKVSVSKPIPKSFSIDRKQMNNNKGFAWQFAASVSQNAASKVKLVNDIIVFEITWPN